MNRPSCFVIMPFAEAFDPVLAEAIRPAVERSLYVNRDVAFFEKNLFTFCPG